MTTELHTYISLLRGINVSSKNNIRMADLQSIYQSLNFSNIRTYLQSGNVIFSTPEQDKTSLAESIQSRIKQEFGFTIDILIREHEDLRRIIDRNPFRTKRHEDPAHLHVTFLSHSLSNGLVNEHPSGTDKKDEFVSGESEIYVFCPEGYGRTKFSNTYFEKLFQQPATTRNWNTIKYLFTATENR